MYTKPQKYLDRTEYNNSNNDSSKHMLGFKASKGLFLKFAF